MTDPYVLIRAERLRQDGRWGANRNLDDLEWLAILTEEVGELAKALLEQHLAQAAEELVQVGAVVVAWLEAAARRPATIEGHPS